MVEPKNKAEEMRLKAATVNAAEIKNWKKWLKEERDTEVKKMYLFALDKIEKKASIGLYQIPWEDITSEIYSSYSFNISMEIVKGVKHLLGEDGFYILYEYDEFSECKTFFSWEERG